MDSLFPTETPDLHPGLAEPAAPVKAGLLKRIKIKRSASTQNRSMTVAAPKRRFAARTGHPTLVLAFARS